MTIFKLNELNCMLTIRLKLLYYGTLTCLISSNKLTLFAVGHVYMYYYTDLSCKSCRKIPS